MKENKAPNFNIFVPIEESSFISKMLNEKLMILHIFKISYCEFRLVDEFNMT